MKFLKQEIVFVDVAIIGSGLAGLTTCLTLCNLGIKPSRIALIERNNELGGVLRFSRDIICKDDVDFVASDYIDNLRQSIKNKAIKIYSQTTAFHISKQRFVSCVSKDSATVHIKSKVVVIACGAREKTRANLNILGDRSSSVFCAGSIQEMLKNGEITFPNDVVILGVNRLSLSLADSIEKAGGRVKCLINEEKKPSSYEKSHPNKIIFNATCVSIEGKERIEKIVIEREAGKLDEITTSMLIISKGFLPEVELENKSKITLADTEEGIFVKTDENHQTNFPRVYVIGDARIIHPDFASIIKESEDLANKICEIIK